MALRALLAVALLLATAPVFAQIPCSSITNEASSGALTCTEGAQPGVQVMGAEHPNHAHGYWVDTPGLLDGSWTYLAAGTNAMGDSSTMCGGTGRAGTTRVNHLGHGGPTAAGLGWPQGASYDMYDTAGGYVVSLDTAAQVVVACQEGRPADTTQPGATWVVPGTEPAANTFARYGQAQNTRDAAPGQTTGNLPMREYPQDYTIPEGSAGFTPLFEPDHNDPRDQTSPPWQEQADGFYYTYSDANTPNDNLPNNAQTAWFYESTITAGEAVQLCCTTSTPIGMWVRNIPEAGENKLPPTGGNEQKLRLGLYDTNDCGAGFSVDTAAGVQCKCPENYVHTTMVALHTDCICTVTCKK